MNNKQFVYKLPIWGIRTHKIQEIIPISNIDKFLLNFLAFNKKSILCKFRKNMLTIESWVSLFLNN